LKNIRPLNPKFYPQTSKNQITAFNYPDNFHDDDSIRRITQDINIDLAIPIQTIKSKDTKGRDITSKETTKSKKSK